MVGTALAIASAVLLPQPAAAADDRGFFLLTRADHGFIFSFGLDRGRAEASLFRGDPSGSQGATYKLKGRTRLAKSGRFRADFGSLGVVRGRYVDAPGRPECRDDFGASGTVRGSIRFEGEGGYAKASAKRARAYVTSFACGGDSRRSAPPGPGRAPQKTTFLLSCQPENRLIYSASEVSKAETSHVARISQRRKGLRILRQTQWYGPSSSFAHASNLSTATVSPGGYFAGSATLADGQLGGDLTVELAGLGATPLVPSVAGLADGSNDEIPARCADLAALEF